MNIPMNELIILSPVGIPANELLFHSFSLQIDSIERCWYFFKMLPALYVKVEKFWSFVVACYATLHPAMLVGRSGFFFNYSAFFEFCLVTLLLPLSSCTRLGLVMYPTLLIVRVNLWQHFPLKMVKHKMVIPLKRVLKESCSVNQQWKVCQSVSWYRLGYTIFCEI